MNEPTMETLARRLDRVERENRWLKQAGVVALAVIAAVVLMGQATTAKVAKVIEAEKFVLRDGQGRERAALEMKVGVVRLVLKDQDGGARALVGISPKGGSGLYFYDPKHLLRIILAVYPDGSPRLVLREKDGETTIWSTP